ncbi:MAG: hypothetical protein ACI9YU_001291 [Flavobacteriales bacterium]|jgi:hypothetical protein
METLYRGVSEKMHNERIGLTPKGTSLLRMATYDGKYATYDGSLTYGQSHQNSILAHQIHSGKYPSSGVSSSTELKIARKYATHNNSIGFVYEIDFNLLKDFGVEAFVVAEIVASPKFPFDNEVILRHEEDGPIPYGIVLRATKVLPG